MEHVRHITSLYREIAYDFYATGRQIFRFMFSLTGQYGVLLKQIYTELATAVKEGTWPNFLLPAIALIVTFGSIWMYVLVLYIV